MGAECMVCCDSGKTFLRDLWGGVSAPDELDSKKAALKNLTRILEPHELVAILNFPCALNFTAFDYLDNNQYDSIRDEVLEVWAEAAIKALGGCPALELEPAMGKRRRDQQSEASPTSCGEFEETSSSGDEATHRHTKRGRGDAEAEYEQILATRDGLSTHLMECAERHSFVICDAGNDQPIVYANSLFTTVTQYSQQEILNRNCRFLQGPETDMRDIYQISAAVKSKRLVRVPILNYRKDQTTFINQFMICPLRSTCGEVTHFLGIQSCSAHTFQLFEREYAWYTTAEFASEGMEGEMSNTPNATKVKLNPLAQRAAVNICHDLAGTRINS